MAKTNPFEKSYFSPRKIQMREQNTILKLSTAKISKLRRRNTSLHRYVMLKNLKKRVEQELTRNRLEYMEELFNGKFSP